MYNNNSRNQYDEGENNYNNENNNDKVASFDYCLILHRPSSIALGAILNALDGIGADVFSSWA